MDCFRKIRTLKSGIHIFRDTFQPFLCSIVPFQIPVFKPEAEPRCGRIGQHSVQGSRQHFRCVDCRAVKHQLGPFIPCCSFFCNIRFPRRNKVRQFLPVGFPDTPLGFQLVETVAQFYCPFIYCHISLQATSSRTCYLL